MRRATLPSPPCLARAQGATVTALLAAASEHEADRNLKGLAIGLALVIVLCWAFGGKK